MSITTEEAERLAATYVSGARSIVATALRSLAAERDTLRAERDAERNARFNSEAEFSHMQRRIARQRRALVKLYAKRHDRKAERDALRAALKTARRNALEEAARVAEDRYNLWHMPHPDDAKPFEVCDDASACRDIAAAIRALGEKE
jgi:hypothetical protein